MSPSLVGAVPKIPFSELLPCPERRPLRRGSHSTDITSRVLRGGLFPFQNKLKRGRERSPSDTSQDAQRKSARTAVFAEPRPITACAERARVFSVAMSKNPTLFSDQISCTTLSHPHDQSTLLKALVAVDASAIGTNANLENLTLSSSTSKPPHVACENSDPWQPQRSLKALISTKKWR